jgi:hypothetical protein
MKKYPDVGLLLELKSARRKRLARLSFEEKIAIVNKWRALTKIIRASQSNSESAIVPEQGKNSNGKA